MTRQLLAVAGVAALLLALGASPSWASCTRESGSGQRARADAVFLGVALDGPAADGYLVSPARFEVLEYEKGTGARVVDVTTGTLVEGLHMTALSNGIHPEAGERWRIYGRHNGEVIETSACDGSHRIGADLHAEDDGTDGVPPEEVPGDEPRGSRFSAFGYWPVSLFTVLVIGMHSRRARSPMAGGTSLAAMVSAWTDRAADRGV